MREVCSMTPDEARSIRFLRMHVGLTYRRLAEWWCHSKDCPLPKNVQEFGQVLQAWMISQIPDGTECLDQLVCDGKTLRGSAIETDDGNHRFVAQVTVYARALGVALAQKAYDTHESSERSALKELLSSMDLDGVLIQADALHTTQSFFAGASPRVGLPRFRGQVTRRHAMTLRLSFDDHHDHVPTPVYGAAKG